MYYCGMEHTKFLKQVYSLYFSENAAGPSMFPSLRKMEAEVVSMVSDLLAGSARTCGTMTSGGTESILLAMKAYRIVYMVLDTLIIVAFIAVAMAICAKQVAATQFALFMALGNVGYSAGSAAFGPLTTVLSYEAIFVVFAAVTIAAIFAIRQVSIAGHLARLQDMRTAEQRA